MMPGHDWPAWVAVDVTDIGGPMRFLIVQPGHSGFECISGDPLGGLTTLGSVDRYLMHHRGLERLPSVSERAAALYGALFGWDHLLAQPAGHEPSPRD